MEKKRKLSDIVTTGGVGLLTLLGGIETVKTAVEIGDSIASHIEKYAGIIGSGAGAVEYGFPLVVGLGALSFMYTATKATDNYLLEHQKE